MKLTYISDVRCVSDVSEGVLLSDALRSMGADVTVVCGGNGKCGKCRVLCSGALSSPDDEEKNILGEDLEKGYRLACRACILGDVTVYGEKKSAAVRKKTAISVPEGVLCVDLGTTGISCVYGGEEISFNNPQSVYGADVISRITASGEHLEDMQRLVKNELARLAPDPRITVISGNTAMQLIYVGIDPSPLGISPYKSPTLFGNVCENTYYMPCVSGFVGGDVVSGLYYARNKGFIKEKTALYIDIGTNGEMVLLHNGTAAACATAAGPCFEGAGISCGMQAVAGAVSGARAENGELVYSVIGNEKMKGICGSGIVSIISSLFELGKISDMGLLENDRFYLSDDVYITRSDVRMIQNAKAAVRAGIVLLCAHVGICEDDIESVYIAGGFGSHLDTDAAKNIGLLPSKPCIILGNCSLYGACEVSRDANIFKEMCSYAEKIRYLELAECSGFSDEYISRMMF